MWTLGGKSVAKPSLEVINTTAPDNWESDLHNIQKVFSTSNISEHRILGYKEVCHKHFITECKECNDIVSVSVWSA